MTLPLILASASPRRRSLLQGLGVSFECIPADIDETPLTDEPAEDYVQRMALEKAQRVAAGFFTEEVAVLGADTSVVVDDAILGKPADRDEAQIMLESLSGRGHRVLTGVCLVVAGNTHCQLIETEVRFTALDQDTLYAYLSTEEPWDKAGAYAIQGLGGALVESIEGSYSNVVGLPLCETRELLREAGITTGLDPLPDVTGELQGE